MRGLFSRIWGGLVHLDDCDPIQHLGDPDETAGGDVDEQVRAVIADHLGPSNETPDPAPAPVAAETVERLDVPSERRPWDMQARVQAPPTPPRPLPADRERACIDEQSDRRCDGVDALTGLITEFKALASRVAELERWVGAIEYQCPRCEDWSRAEGPDDGDFYCESCGGQMLLHLCAARPAGQDGGAS